MDISLIQIILTSPLLLNPRISKLILEVRPDWISWRCLKRLSRALPRPLSSSPWVSTPSNVDLPESTFPSTATRRSKNYVGTWKHTHRHTQLTQSSKNTPKHKYKTMSVEPVKLKPYLLIVRYFSNKDFCYFTGDVRVIIHFALSEDCYVCTYPEENIHHNTSVVSGPALSWCWVGTCFLALESGWFVWKTS